MKLIFDESSVGFMLEAFELSTDEDGYVMAGDEYAAVSDGSEKLHKDEVAVFEHDESCPKDVLLVPDTFHAIVEHTKRMDTNESSLSKTRPESLE